MMTMSKALSSGQAKDYYQKEYTSARENYYSERGEVNGRWSGRLAEEWNLKGEVQSEQLWRGNLRQRTPGRLGRDLQCAEIGFTSGIGRQR